jgi:5-methylcytosine-specific restriction protein B
MSRLKNYYTHLITNRRQAVDGWLSNYKAITAEVTRIRERLLKGGRLQDAATYEGEIHATKPDPFHSFAAALIYDDDNGITTTGLSLLSEPNFNELIKNTDFTNALENLIRDPDAPSHFADFKVAWAAVGAGNNPLRWNRVLAACTTLVSTTCDEKKFNAVYGWMIGDGGLIAPPPEPAPDWRARNLHLMSEFHTHFENEISSGETDPHLLSVFVWELHANNVNPFSLRKQLIRYGAPGTGKTFKAMQDAKLQFAIWKSGFDPDSRTEAAEHIRTVQFHPSYTYEDFMEGLRPAIADGTSKLKLENGIFKRLCISAGQWELDLANEVSVEMAENWNQITISELIPFRDKLKHPRWVSIFKNDGAKKVSEAVPPFFLIIDEINRAELSRVLGELMFCLEYRGIKGAIQTQYSTLNDADTGMLKTGDSYQFFIPHNIFVIGTMNTIDRSVESFDFALRRRFRWEEVGPDISVLRHYLNQTHPSEWLKLADGLENLNQRITNEPLLGSDHQIGHAYLMNLSYEPELTLSQVRENVWQDFIKPLLEEYLRGTGKTKDLLKEFATSFGLR